MEAAALEQRIRLGEDSRTEFKGVAQSNFRLAPQDIAKAIVSLANTRGGVLVIGVDDDGKPSGTGTTQQTDALMRQVVQACQDSIQPSIACAIEKAELHGVNLLLVEVTAFSSGRPYRADRGYYVRDGSVSREATRDDLVRLLQSQDHHYDEEPLAGAKLADLDGAAIQRAFALLYGVVDPRETSRYLRALGCLDDDETPTVTGVLFFGREPSRWLPDARVSAVRIEGTMISSTFLDRQELAGRVTEQIEAAGVFLQRHMGSSSEAPGWERTERPGPGRIPQPALREAVLNAIAHRDYKMTSQTRIFVFDDRVEVVSPGGLLNRLTLESIRLGGVSQRRNPRIAALLVHLQRREHLGFGVFEMIRQMADQGLPEPEFGLQGGHFRVTLRGRPRSAP